MSYRDPQDEWLEMVTGMVITGFFFWVIFFLMRDLLVASPI